MRHSTLSAVLTAALAFALPASAVDREVPRYGGTLNVGTVFAGLNALSFKHYNWPWKTNHDALYLDQLIAGDLD
ncbi:MAG: ABC transporter substrate-binding protein, partial [Alphaproteobacteria bacterium]|nr:ABC transporter substrate-binding protein [Alphaproteobacteria bacterium]